MCCDYMLKEEPEYFQSFLDDQKLEDYVSEMREDGTWGSQMEIVALCRAYKVNCVIFRPDGLHYRIEDQSGGCSKILMISHHDDEHFNVVRFRGKDNSCLESFDEIETLLALNTDSTTSRPLSKKEKRLLIKNGEKPQELELPSQKLVSI